MALHELVEELMAVGNEYGCFDLYADKINKKSKLDPMRLQVRFSACSAF